MLARHPTLGAVFLGVLVFAACGGDGEPPTPTPDVDATQTTKTAEEVAAKAEAIAATETAAVEATSEAGLAATATTEGRLAPTATEAAAEDEWWRLVDRTSPKPETQAQETYLEELKSGEREFDDFGNTCVFIPSVGLADCRRWVRPPDLDDSWGYIPSSDGVVNIVERCEEAAESLGSKWTSGTDVRVYHTYYSVWCGSLPECVDFDLPSQYSVELCGTVLRDTRFTQGFNLDADRDGIRDDCDGLFESLGNLILGGAVPDAFFIFYQRKCG